ncbi:MMPL family transporter [Nocardia sp. NPDC020380]|uniref:MMPL family transporter n=1 Tax=Nocardia sp. NPDC020380 TaxID=3364309 RepID=UPI0037A4ED2F
MRTWAKFVTIRPRLVLVGTLLLILVSGVWGLGVVNRLDLGGYDDPNSDSAQVDNFTQKTFGRQTPDIVAIYTAPPGKTLNDIGPQVLNRLHRVNPSLLATPIQSYWTSPSISRIAMTSADQTKALAIFTLRGDDNQILSAYQKLVPLLTVPGTNTQFTGYSAVTNAYNNDSKHDVVLAEAIAIPITLVLLLVIFGSLVAAATPIVVGGLTIFGSLGPLYLISMGVDISAFALDVASILGLGLAIDYGLFMVSRFREELRTAPTPAAAAARTVCTAGRTIGYSALLMTCAFAGALVAPIAMLRSLEFGAMAAIDIAALLTLTAVPAALTLLGDRINALPWRRGAVERGAARALRFWAAVAKRVTARPAITTAGIGALLLLMCVPLFGLQAGGVDVSGLPKQNPVRIAQATVTADFPNATNGATLLVRGTGDAPPAPAALDSVSAAAQQVPGVREVVELQHKDDLVLLHAVLTSEDFSAGARSTVTALRRIPVPAGVTVLIGGENAIGQDTNTAIFRSFPTIISVMLLATLVVMLLAFRSIVLPLKAVVLAVLSLGATFGLLIWIFQDNHGAGLLGADPGPLPFPALIAIAGAVFGLSTDYEVFLMSRIVEAHRDGATTREAVVTGVSRTGRIITSAATLLIIVTGMTALSGVKLIKVGGFGMAAAIFIDATIVRMLLVPALITLMGAANWWLPKLRPPRYRPVEITPAAPKRSPR